MKKVMMRNKMKIYISILCCLLTLGAKSQLDQLKLDPVKVKMFLPYVAFKHGGGQTFENWKQNNKLLYTKEMWYYSESFYVKRNHLNEGVTLNEEIIDVARFESQRKENEEVIVTIGGFKDAIVLLPAKDLIYKP